MSNNIANSFDDLVKLQKEGIYTISKLHWWLSKYYEIYKICKENWNNCSCFGKLPCSHTLNSEENNFIEFYRELDEISELHKLNRECGIKIFELLEFKGERELITNWVKKNEDLYHKLLIGFWIDTEIIENHILLYFSNYKDLEIKIDQTEFKNIIDFLELYSLEEK